MFFGISYNAGNRISITGEDGITISYWHLQAGGAIATNPRTNQLFQLNNWVEQGDIIGYTGITGNANANVPHLHIRSSAGNPEPLLNVEEIRTDTVEIRTPCDQYLFNLIIKKNMKRITLILLICFPLIGNAQSVFDSQYGGTFTSGIIVGNLEIGLKYTQNEIIAVLGSPSTYYTHMSEFGLSERYLYEDTSFSFQENGLFVGFNMSSDNFVIFEQDNGGIRVGDLISKVTELLRTGWTLEAKPNGMYELWMYDEVMCFRVENDLIVRINYSASL